MPQRRASLSRAAAQSELGAALAALRRELQVPEGFPADVAAEAKASARLPLGELPDLTGIEFLTIDPAGSTDLDQALHLARSGAGFVLHYAIADVPFFVAPGGAVDAEARRRGQTLYAPDGRIPLHPSVLSDGAASLLPGVDRRAFVFRFETDAAAKPASMTLTRARIRSRRAWGYEEAQTAFEAGTAPESIALMKEFGEARLALEAERGGASLDSPDERVELVGGAYTIVRRTPLPIEQWNAQLSLLTGMAAAEIMLRGGVGILRTMPPADERALAAFRAKTAALGLPWPGGIRYGDYLRGLDRSDSRALAVLQAATSLFRGAGYEAFDGAPPRQSVQAALAAPYTHTTAPLRRLVDRWSLIVTEALANGREAPDWVRRSLPELPDIMARTGQLASRLDAEAVNRVEAALLVGRIGQVFDAVVVAQEEGRARVQLVEPPVEASVPHIAAAPGTTVRLRLAAADIATGTIAFQPA